MFWALFLAAPFEMVIQNGHASTLTAAEISPDGSIIISTSLDRTLKLWSLDGKLLNSIHHPEGLTALTFDQSGYFYTGDESGKIRRYQTNTGKKVGEWQAHKGEIRALAAGSALASAGVDGLAKVWSAQGTPQKVFNEENAHYVEMTGVAWVGPGRLISSAINRFGRRQYTLVEWDLRRGRITAPEGAQAPNSAYVMATRGSTVAVAVGHPVIKSEKDRLELWREGKKIRSYPMPAAITALAYGPDGALYAGSQDGLLYVLVGGQLKKYTVSAHPITSLAVTPQGQEVLIGSSSFFGEGSRLQLWSQQGEPTLFPGHLGSLGHLAWHPNGAILATAASYPGKEVTLWSLTGRPIRRFAATEKSEVTHLLWDGDDLVTGSRDGYLRRWRAGRLSATATVGKPIYDLDIQSDRILVGAADGVAQIRYGVKTLSLDGISGNTYAVAWLADARGVTGGQDRRLRLWSSDGKILATSEPLSGGIIKIQRQAHILRIALDNDTWHEVPVEDGLGKLGPARKGYLLTHDGARAVWVTGEQTLFSAGTTQLRRPGQPGNAALHPTRPLVALGNGDGTMTWWRTDTGAETYLLAAQDDWLIYGPDGYFDASRRGSERVAMVRGRQAFSVEQFAPLVNRPDILLERLGVADADLLAHYRQRYLLRLAQGGYAETAALKTLTVPQVNIIGHQRQGDNLVIQAEAQDPSLRRARLRINGVKVIEKGLNGPGVFEFKVPLGAGKNRAEVSVLDQRGVESFRARLDVEHPGKKTGRLWILALGVSRYQAEGLSLALAHKDAERFTALWPGAQKRVLLDDAVTLEALQAAANWLSGAQVDDTVAFFIAGHGLHDTDIAGTYYFLPGAADPERLEKTAIPWSLLESLWDQTPARNRLMFLDTCESGLFADEGQGPKGAVLAARGVKKRVAQKSWSTERDRFIYHDIWGQRGLTVLSSSRGGEPSFESPNLGAGLFTYALLEGLRDPKTDLDQDGWVSALELEKKVSRWVSEASGGQQNPVLDRENLAQKAALPRPR